MHDADASARRREVTALFLRLGFTAFGGPAAHVAMMEDEVVRRRGWIERTEFLDLVSACNLIPGPNSTELAIHLGYRRAGWPGLLLAGACFIAPAASIVLAMAWAYQRFGALPDVARLLYGVKPVVVAVVAQALVGFARSALRTGWLVGIAVAAAAASALGVHELVVLAGAGALACGALVRRPPPLAVAPIPFVAAGSASTALAVAAPAATTAAPASLGAIFGTFAKIGSVLFGSGYVLLAFLRDDLVTRLHWLTEAQVLDAVAVGQVTPGPVFTTATFVGYLLAGPTGGLVATAGIFLPAFVFVALTKPLVPRLRRSRVAGALLDGVNAGSLALMAVTGVALARAAVMDAPSALIGLTSLAALVRFRVSSTWLVLAGAALGLAFGPR